MSILSENSFSDDVVNISKSGAIAAIVIDNPDKRNAISIGVASRISECLASAEMDASVRVVVITGAGNRAFASGADLDELPAVFETSEGARSYDAKITRLYRAIENCKLPVIARMAGAAIGGGCLLALACDVRIASASIKVGFPASRIGLMLSPREYELLLECLPLSQAKRLMFTGERISAADAAALGLIDQVVPPEELDGAVEEAALAMAEGAPTVIAASKRIANAIKRGEGLEEAISQSYRTIYPSRDLSEGLAALKEKRKPVFRR